MPAQLTQYFGRNIESYQCKLLAVNGIKMFMLDFDGIINGTRSIQYQFQKSPAVKIIITATTKNSALNTIRQEFDAIVRSIKKN